MRSSSATAQRAAPAFQISHLGVAGPTAFTARPAALLAARFQRTIAAMKAALLVGARMAREPPTVGDGRSAAGMEVVHVAVAWRGLRPSPRRSAAVFIGQRSRVLIRTDKTGRYVDRCSRPSSTSRWLTATLRRRRHLPHQAAGCSSERGCSCYLTCPGGALCWAPSRLSFDSTTARAAHAAGAAHFSRCHGPPTTAGASLPRAGTSWRNSLATGPVSATYPGGPRFTTARADQVPSATLGDGGSVRQSGCASVVEARAGRPVDLPVAGNVTDTGFPGRRNPLVRCTGAAAFTEVSSTLRNGRTATSRTIVVAPTGFSPGRSVAAGTLPLTVARWPVSGATSL